ncbi:hypothetical protein TEA_022835 [Camellia sinensis var. sinensis]|uniref:Plastid lipid-associated protein/fibrillin conserved domain-containing protein n=1 Tax=Camellia sinensis var. sinensis TaxID=542762 RepID=A0A4S4E1U1_CAMSN|nr:hypothetical protein TEA_022835 [Camellia sinensis var. sinensis]
MKKKTEKIMKKKTEEKKKKKTEGMMKKKTEKMMKNKAEEKKKKKKIENEKKMETDEEKEKEKKMKGKDKEGERAETICRPADAKEPTSNSHTRPHTYHQIRVSNLFQMASSIQGLVPAFFGLRSRASSYSSSATIFPESGLKIFKMGRKVEDYGVCKAMVQTVQGASATYAKEMERLSAKESLLLAFKDSGGFEAVVSGKTTDLQRIDVNERIIGLERLNPTPRPTTSPFLEGRWNFEWLGSGSPGLIAATFVFQRFPSTLANLSKMDLVIKDGYGKITAIMRLLNSSEIGMEFNPRLCIESSTFCGYQLTIESKFVLSTQFSVEGPLRMKEEYMEGVLELPTVDEETIPEQLRGAFGQAVSTVQQLPVSIRDVMASGLKVPLSGTFQRLFIISYLDDEILLPLNPVSLDPNLIYVCHQLNVDPQNEGYSLFMKLLTSDDFIPVLPETWIVSIIRDSTGVPEVLTRLDAPPSPLAESMTEYES